MKSQLKRSQVKACTVIFTGYDKRRGQDLLTNFELEMTALRARAALPDGAYDPAHYRAIHRHLFQDVYSWAGAYRTVRTAKGGVLLPGTH